MVPVAQCGEITRIITNRELSPVFQGIVDLDARALLGYEALIRGPANTSLHSPLTLFETANRCGCLSELEFACREVSVAQFVRLNLPGKVFINVSPMSLLDEQHRDGIARRILDETGLPPSRIVIELSEQYPLDDYELIRNATLHYREMGFEIAIDDLGAGYAGLRIWAEIRPEYVKIDRHFIENIHQDSVKREFVRSIREIAVGLGCRVIAEGVELAEELDAVRSIGINLVQGYYFGRPAAMPPLKIDQLIDPPNHRVAMMQSRASETVGMLVQSVPTLSPDMRLEEVVELLQASATIRSIPVVADAEPLGMVLRQDLLELYSGRYSRELHGRKPISLFMRKDVLRVEESARLEEASRELTRRPDSDLGQDFIIVRDGIYLGIGRTRDLLVKITEQQIRSARYSNPLTLLPGSVPLHDFIDSCLEKTQHIVVAYIDINHFKSYNDAYGYNLGDSVIVRLAEKLRSLSQYDGEMLAHIGGDDFIAVLSGNDW